MEIITRRFLLRDFTEGDQSAFLAYHADPRYLALYEPEEDEPGHAQGFFQTFRRWASERPRHNYQLAIVQRHEPQALIGCGGLRRAGCDAGSAEFGIELAPTYWGRYGYAIEAAWALLAFGFSDPGLQEIRGVTVSANSRVARLARWFGAVAIATRPGPAWMRARGWSQTEWQITRERWERKAGLTDTTR